MPPIQHHMYYITLFQAFNTENSINFAISTMLIITFLAKKQGASSGNRDYIE